MNLDKGSEIKLNEVMSIYSRTDLEGRINYVNDYFTEVSGYSESELLGKHHNIIRHPDMPRVIFKLMWERIQQNQNMLAVVKNLAKNGDYYWVTTSFETKYHPFTKKPEGYLAIRQAAPKKALQAVIPLYQTLRRIEKKESMEAAEAYLFDYLRDKNTDYDSYIEELVHYNSKASSFFSSIRKIFS